MPVWRGEPNIDGQELRLPGVGIKLRPAHVVELLARCPKVIWFEEHAANYMYQAPTLSRLISVREYYSLSLYGVAFSLGGPASLDKDHLSGLTNLVERLDPFLVSEHLAWTGTDGVHFDDLVPPPYTKESLGTVSAYVLQTQGVVGRRMLIEKPPRYGGFRHSMIGETEFLAELVRRTGRGFLCDASNSYVGAYSIRVDPARYFETPLVGTACEIHLAGHTASLIGDRTILIDDHTSRVPWGVWALFCGQRDPTRRTTYPYRMGCGCSRAPCLG